MQKRKIMAEKKKARFLINNHRLVKKNVLVSVCNEKTSTTAVFISLLGPTKTDNFEIKRFLIKLYKQEVVLLYSVEY